MIILSGVLVVVAIALLVAGIVAGNGDSAEVFNLDALFVIYISIAVSIVSALCLAIGVFLRRKELFGPGVSSAPARQGKAKKSKKDKRKKGAPAVPAANATGVPQAAATGAEAPPDDEMEIPAPLADVPGDALVFVVRGRKRYHLDTCRQLAGRETEDLTYAEAKEEGFSPCTACMPDTALAARAAASGPASPDAGKAAGDVPASGKSGPAPAKSGMERSEGGLAGLARPAPSPVSAPTSFDKTAEIPRADGTDRPDRAAEREPERPAPGPAGPTLTDIPVASIFTPAKPAEPAETAGAAEPERWERPAGERPAETESAPADVTVDLGPTPDPAPEADPATDPATGSAAPRPRDADDEDADVSAPPRAEEPEPAAETPAGETPAAEPGGDDGGPQVRILSGTKRYHRTDCALIEDIGDEADDLESLSRGAAKSRGCTPCLVCQPDREHARD